MQLNTFLCLLNFSFLVIVAQTASIEAASRILGGSEAAPGQFPFQVAVLSDGEQICGGSIISENYVVTAAHCVCFRDEWTGMSYLLPIGLFSIRAGSISRSSGGKQIQINHAFVHPFYISIPKLFISQNDIALLKLSEPLTFSDSIKAINLAREAPPAGASITISGWGDTKLFDKKSEKLKFNNNMKATPDNQAKKLYLEHDENNGAASGDSGGPAVYQNELVGVASYIQFIQLENGETVYSTHPNGYTMIPSFYEWIRNNSDLKNVSYKQ